MEGAGKKVSIITVNLNNCAGLEKTIGSVVGQTYDNIEYIIIDGGSTDGSLEAIKKQETGIDYWISEKDKGVYNAMNKGIQKATGEYCYFLNSGDYLVSSDVVEKVFAQSAGEDIVYGNMIHGGKETVEHGLKEITFFDFFTGSIYHQSAFIKRALFDTAGYYNESLKIVSDWEFFIKAIFIYGCSLKYTDVDVARYETGGLSFQNPANNLRERQQVLEKYFKRYLKDYEDYTRYRQSNLAGIHKFVEHSMPVNRSLGAILSAARFIRFKVLRQKH